jgi:hemoglobin
MQRTITSKADIIELIDAFYIKVRQDELIGFFFEQIVQVNWEKHLPVMYEFWDNIVFSTGHYQGNPMGAHFKIHAISPMKAEHFQRWLSLFFETVDEHFTGENADLIKRRAESIAYIMQAKIVT